MEKINIGGVTLAGYAQGGWRTVVHVPEIRAVFDAGAVLETNVDHVFLTHGHADHTAALPYTVSLRAIRRNERTLNVYLPAEIAEPMQRLLDAMREVQRDSEHEADVRLYPARPGYFFELQRGVVVIESIWPNAAFEEGIGVNALVSADPGPPLGGAVFHDTAVWMRAADPKTGVEGAEPQHIVAESG